MQPFGLFGVRVSKGLGSSFKEVLVVSHLGDWHAVELVCKGNRCFVKNGKNSNTSKLLLRLKLFSQRSIITAK